MNINEESAIEEMLEETGLIKNDLVSCETKTREILKNNNISFEKDDKLNTLISKFNDIKIGGDFEIVEGDVPECVITEENEKSFTINTNLGFIPKMIILYINGHIYIDGKMVTANCSIIYNNSIYKYDAGFVHDGENGLKKIYVSIEKVSKNSFNIKIQKASLYEPTDNKKETGIEGSAKWYAIK